MTTKEGRKYAPIILCQKALLHLGRSFRGNLHFLAFAGEPWSAGSHPFGSTSEISVGHYYAGPKEEPTGVQVCPLHA